MSAYGSLAVLGRQPPVTLNGSAELGRGPWHPTLRWRVETVSPEVVRMGLLFDRERHVRCQIHTARDVAATAADPCRRIVHLARARKLARSLPTTLAEQLLVIR